MLDGQAEVSNIAMRKVLKSSTSDQIFPVVSFENLILRAILGHTPSVVLRGVPRAVCLCAALGSYTQMDTDGSPRNN